MTNSFGEYLQKQIEYEKSKLDVTKHGSTITQARKALTVLTEVQFYFEQYKNEEEARYNELLNKYNTLLGGLDKALHHLANEDTTDVYVVDAIHNGEVKMASGYGVSANPVKSNFVKGVDESVKVAVKNDNSYIAGPYLRLERLVKGKWVDQGYDSPNPLKPDEKQYDEWDLDYFAKGGTYRFKVEAYRYDSKGNFVKLDGKYYTYDSKGNFVKSDGTLYTRTFLVK